MIHDDWMIESRSSQNFLHFSPSVMTGSQRRQDWGSDLYLFEVLQNAAQGSVLLFPHALKAHWWRGLQMGSLSQVDDGAMHVFEPQLLYSMVIALKQDAENPRHVLNMLKGNVKQTLSRRYSVVVRCLSRMLSVKAYFFLRASPKWLRFTRANCYLGGCHRCFEPNQRGLAVKHDGRPGTWDVKGRAMIEYLYL